MSAKDCDYCLGVRRLEFSLEGRLTETHCPKCKGTGFEVRETLLDAMALKERADKALEQAVLAVKDK